MSVPYLSPTDRGEALEKAHQIRSLRYQLRTEIKEGRITLQEILDKSDDEVIGKMRVKYLLESLPDVGRAKAASAMEDIGIAALRRIQGLGERQKAELIQRFVVDIAEREATEKAEAAKKDLNKIANAERRLADTMQEIDRITGRQGRAEDALRAVAATQQELAAKKVAAAEALAVEKARIKPVLARVEQAERTLEEDIVRMNDILGEESALHQEKALIRASELEPQMRKARLNSLSARMSMLEERKSLAKATLAQSRAVAREARAEKAGVLRGITAAERALRAVISAEEKLLRQKDRAEKALTKAAVAQKKALEEKARREVRLVDMIKKYETLVDAADR